MKTKTELNAIHQASQRLQSLTTPDVLAQDIIALLEDLLNYEFGAVLLFNEETGELYPFAISDQGKGETFIEIDKKYISSHKIKIGKGITGWVAQHGKTIRSGDVTKDPRYYSLRTDIHSELCVPMMVKSKIIGVINIETPNENAYSEVDQLVLETVASQIAIAIQNSKMFEQVKNYSSQLEKHVEKLKKTEARLRKELKDKQILIKEIHHRVKNR